MKSKHLLLMLLLALLAPWAANGQDLADYTFTTGQDQSQWITLSDGATPIVASGDDYYSSLTDIGFSFPFGDGTYTQFWANANGVFSFSNTPADDYSVAFGSSKYTSSQPKICGITKDMGLPSSGYVKYELTGSASNRVLVCEFYLKSTSGSSGTPTVNFQVQLHESDSKVVLVYGASASVSSFQIGLSQSSSDIWTINPTTHEATHATGAVSTTYSAWPGEYRYYEFTRPIISCPKPSGLTCTASTGNPAPSATFSWTSNGTETDWVLEYSTASDFTGATSINISSSDLNTDGSYTITSGLTAETEYYAHIKADCGGSDESDWSNTSTFKPSDVQSIPIGSGENTTNYFPTHPNWKYSYTQQIYTAAEIGQAGTIKSISFKGSKAGTRSLVIYMANTTKESFSSSTDVIPIADAMQVFSGSVAFTANEWKTIELADDGFDYDGDNLAIIVDDNSGNYTMGTTNWAAFNASSDQALYYYQDSPGDINPSSPSASSNDVSQLKNQIKLGILLSTTPKPKNLAVMDGSLSSSGATLQWAEPNITPNSYEYQYKKATVTDWPTAWTTNNTNLSVALTLDPGTTYDFRVRAVYSEGESDPVEIQFTTLDNCAFPTNLIATITPGQGTKATFSWTKGFSEDSHWVLQYGTDNNFATYTEVTTGFTVEGNIVSFEATTGITAEMLHYARVKTDCGGTYSEWSNVAEFTPTNFVDYPYNNGATSSNSIPPFYGYYANNATNQSQFVIPAAELAEIAGGTIRSITYYTTNTSTTTDWGGVIFDVYMAEVENSTFSSATFIDWDDLTNVYTGTVSLSNGMMTITFDHNYTYNGGNLLIGFKTNTAGTATQSISWMASYRSGEYNTVYQYSTYSVNRNNYFPKVTFNYLPTAFVRVTEINEGTITTNSAELTWMAPSENATGYAYQYKKATAAEWPTDWTNTTATTATLSPLDHSTTYNFRIKALYGSNNESTVTTFNFNTACDIINSFPVSYGFETSEGFPSNVSIPTTNQLGACWRNEATVQNGNNPTRVWGTSTSYKNNGSQSLVLPDKGNSTNYAKTMLAFPAMNFSSANGYKLSLWVLRGNSGSNPEGFKVYVSNTDTIDASAVELGHYSRNYNIAYPQIESASGWYQYIVYIPQATITGTVYLIFEGQSYYGNATYVDDVTIEEAPSCYPLGTLTHDNVGAHSVELSWSLVDNSQTAWVVEYADNSEFENAQTANANTNVDFELNGLTHETHYYVRVKADCGANDYGEVSNVVDFTTEIACHAPTALHMTANTTASITIDWTNGDEGQDKWDVAYKETESTADFTVVENVTDKPYTIGNLTDGKTYTIKILANCGTVDGYSQWSETENMQTVASCATPENVAVTANSETAHGAEITWTGAATNHKIEYREVITSPAEVDETYDFEDGTMQGWTSYDEDGDGNGWTNASGSGNNGSSRYMSSRYNSSAVPNDWLISPEIPLGGTLSFYAKKSSGTEQFQVYVSTTGTDISNFTAISEVIDATSTWQLYTYDLSSYSGNGYVAIKHTGAVDQYWFYVDDITITASIAGEYGEWQTVSNVTSPHTFNDLDPETNYEVRVIGDCGATTSPYSDMVSFTTLVACIPPTNLTYSNVTAHTADLTWNVNGNTTTHYVLIKNGVESDIAVTINEGVASYTIEELNGETEYTVSVKANCDEEGYSSESNEETFTTLVACPAPTNMEVTVSGADITVTWEGDATSYNIDVNGTVTEDVASPYIINGELATSYTIKVQAVCAGEGESTWTNEETVTTALCLSENMCEIIFELTDAWGDGWNGNYISVVDVLTNTEFAQLTNEDLNGTDGSGENELNTINLPVCDGREIQFQYHIGVGTTYPTENSWVIKDVNDEIIWEGQGSDGGDHNYTVSCALNPSFTKSIDANSWYAISSPVNTPAVNEVDNLTDDNYDFYRYNEASATWENYKAHATDFTTFENGRGYIYRNSTGDDLTFTGVPNDGNPVTVPFTYTSSLDEHLKGFNLVGNPYTTEATLGKVCYKLNTNGTWAAQLASYAVQPLEGVLVQATSTTDELAFSISSKSAPKAAQTLALTVSGNGYEDVAYAMLEEGKGLNKVAHLAEDAPALSIPVDGSNYAIAYLGYEVESFPLTLNAQAGEYTIALNNQISGLSYCHLLDKETGKETDLLKGAYTFKANGNSDRFTVLLNASIENGEIAIWNGNSWIVNGEGTLQVFDVMGRRVYNQKVAGQSSLNTDELATGVYVIRLGEKSQKIVVK